MSCYHLDTDYLIRALTRAGSERQRLSALLASDAEIEITALTQTLSSTPFALFPVARAIARA